MCSSFFNFCSPVAVGACLEATPYQGGWGWGESCPFLPTFSKSSLSQALYTFHFSKSPFLKLGDSRQNPKPISYDCPVVMGFSTGYGFPNSISGVEGEGLFHVTIDHKFFIFQAVCQVYGLPSVGAEHSTHSDSRSLVSRRLLKEDLPKHGNWETVF